MDAIETKIRDEENPEYIFQTLNTSLILMMANGELDAVEAAKKELSGRGYDIVDGGLRLTRGRNQRLNKLNNKK